MEAPTAFQDWELLQGSDAIVKVSASLTSEDAKPFDGIVDSDSDNGISPDYFALDSNKRYAVVSEEESVHGSDNVSWIDPNSDSRYLVKPRRETGGLWPSDESSDDQRSTIGLGDALDFEESLEMDEIKGFSDNYEECGGEDVRDEEVFDGGKIESENCEELDYFDSNDRRDETQDLAERGSESKKFCDGNGGDSGKEWWKLPLEFLKFYAFKLRPVWSISIAAAVMGFVMLGRRLYKLRHKTKSIPIKIGIDNKKASQFVVRATRLNEAFSMVRRVPIIKTPLPTPGLTLWPGMAFT